MALCHWRRALWKTGIKVQGVLGWFRVNIDTGLFPLGQFDAKGCQSVSETLLLP